MSQKTVKRLRPQQNAVCACGSAIFDGNPATDYLVWYYDWDSMTPRQIELPAFCRLSKLRFGHQLMCDCCRWKYNLDAAGESIYGKLPQHVPTIKPHEWTDWENCAWWLYRALALPSLWGTLARTRDVARHLLLSLVLWHPRGITLKGHNQSPLELGRTGSLLPRLIQWHTLPIGRVNNFF